MKSSSGASKICNLKALAYRAYSESHPGVSILPGVVLRGTSPTMADVHAHQLPRTRATGLRALLVRRTAVLRKLGHINAAGLVQLKGKAACEVGLVSCLAKNAMGMGPVTHQCGAHDRSTMGQ